MYTRERIEQVHKDLTFIVDVVASQPEQTEYRQAVANFRNIDVGVFEKHKCFFVDKPDDLRQLIGDKHYLNQDLGFINKNAYPTYRGRFIFPCYNAKNEVAGMVGYDAAHHYKYLLSSTLGFEKTNVTFGHQDLEFIYQQDYVILVEGIMEYMRISSLGYPCISLQGLSVGPYMKRLLSRLSNIILLLDSDSAGIKAADRIKKIFSHTTSIFMERTHVNKLDADIFLTYKENEKYFRAVVEQVRTKWNQCNYTSVLMKNQSQELDTRMLNARKKEEANNG